jgi:hypothetical protein
MCILVISGQTVVVSIISIYSYVWLITILVLVFPTGGSAFGGFASKLSPNINYFSTQIIILFIFSSRRYYWSSTIKTFRSWSSIFFFGEKLLSVDPFNYPGIIHLPDIPPGAGVFNPNLVVPGVPGINVVLQNSFISI